MALTRSIPGMATSNTSAPRSRRSPTAASMRARTCSNPSDAVSTERSIGSRMTPIRAPASAPASSPAV